MRSFRRRILPAPTRRARPPTVLRLEPLEGRAVPSRTSPFGGLPPPAVVSLDPSAALSLTVTSATLDYNSFLSQYSFTFQGTATPGCTRRLYNPPAAAAVDVPVDATGMWSVTVPCPGGARPPADVSIAFRLVATADGITMTHDIAFHGTLSGAGTFSI